jgi:hypothetical protein
MFEIIDIEPIYFVESSVCPICKNNLSSRCVQCERYDMCGIMKHEEFGFIHNHCNYLCNK